MTRKRIWLWLFLSLVLLLTGCETASRNNGAAHVTFLWKMDDETVFTQVNCQLSKVTNPFISVTTHGNLPLGSRPELPGSKIETTLIRIRIRPFEKWVIVNGFSDGFPDKGMSTAALAMAGMKALIQKSEWVGTEAQQKVVSPG